MIYQHLTIVKSTENKIFLNKKKSAVMKIYNPRNKIKKTNLNKKDLLGIPRVKEYKYLGIWIDEKL